jgi:hypothetical protein
LKGVILFSASFPLPEETKVKQAKLMNQIERNLSMGKDTDIDALGNLT